MSTRALIKVIGTDVTLYRHSDGYPDGEHGVLALLRPLTSEFRRIRGNDPAYFMARLTQVFCNKHDESLEKYPNIKFLGSGLYIEKVDVAYTYTVDLSTGEIKQE